MSEDSRLELIKLKELVNIWQAMPSTNEKEFKSADEFYKEKLLPLTKRLFVEKEKNKLEHNYYGMILTVGKLPESLVLSIKVVNPQRVLFLHTNETEEQLDFIIEHTGLKPSQWERRLIEKPYGLAIYREVIKVWERWGKRNDIAVDITGGTKSMTGGLAMVGALMSFKLLYVDSEEYCNEKKRPVPGTEFLEMLQNAYQVYGCIQEREAESLMERMDYHGAAQIYQQLKEKAPDPRQYEILLQIALGYEAWDLLDFETAGKCLVDAAKKSKRYKDVSPLSNAEITEINNRGKLLLELTELIPTGPGNSTLPLLQSLEAVIVLIKTLYGNASRRAEWGKWDTASLYLYRLLEIMEQRRFATYDVDTAKPDYNKLIYSLNKRKSSNKDNGINILDENALLEKYNSERISFKMEPVSSLPDPISLLSGYLLLNAIDDPYSLKKFNCNRNEKGQISISHLNNQLTSRNYSILAHGISFIKQGHYQGFKVMVDNLLNHFCQVEGINDITFDRPK